MATVDFSQLLKIRDEINEIKTRNQSVKEVWENVEGQAVTMMVSANKRYVDASNSGDGPFVTLSKGGSDGAWNAVRYVEFFSLLFAEMQKGTTITPEKAADEAAKFLKKYQKRKFIIEIRKTQPATTTIMDLVEWQATGYVKPT
jgi:hypothetical protein